MWLSKRFRAEIDVTAYDQFNDLLQIQHHLPRLELEALLGLKPNSRRKSLPFKVPADDNRVFSNYFTNVIVGGERKRMFRPMRYRLRPAGSDSEVPSKYNLFNARLDSLETRETWRPLYNRQHGIFPFKKFFEWVAPSGGKPKLISFYPQNREIMWAPCLWDKWVSPNGEITFESFALITTGPRPEVRAQGHDRCPLFMAENQIESWLNPLEVGPEKIREILESSEPVQYQFSFLNI